MTINSRAKGAAGERELAECFRSMGYTARRSQQYSGADATSDLLVEELPGVLVECKRVQRLNIEEAMQKAASDAAPHLKTPMICHRKNGSEWLVTVRMKDLHTFVERMQRGMARRSTGPAPEVK